MTLNPNSNHFVALKSPRAKAPTRAPSVFRSLRITVVAQLYSGGNSAKSSKTRLLRT